MSNVKVFLSIPLNFDIRYFTFEHLFKKTNMKFLQIVLILLIPASAVFTACQGQGQMIEGVLANASNLQVTLEQAQFDRSNVALGKATTDASGKFAIKPEQPLTEGLYRLNVGAKRLYFVLNGKEKTVEIKGDLNTFDRMEVEIKGSETFACYANVIRTFIKTPPQNVDDARAEIKKGCTALTRAFLTTQLFGQNAGMFLTDFQTASADLAKELPGKYATDYQAMVTSIQSQMAQQQSTEKIQVGQPAPDIRLPGPDGKVRALSDLKGKIVLLDFWASWCGPCRRENPHVVEVYKRYKDKGFEIFSVSLDGADPRMGMTPDQAKQKEADGKRKWMEAIKADGLLWDNHVSDLRHWGSEPAAVYGVTGIPKTFLIGRDGKIVAINPRQNLEDELKKAL